MICRLISVVGLASLFGIAPMTGAVAQERHTYYYYGYVPGPIYGYGPAETYGPTYRNGRVYGYVADPYAARPDNDNRAFGKYVPRSDRLLSESGHFFRGVERQSGGN